MGKPHHSYILEKQQRSTSGIRELRRKTSAALRSGMLRASFRSIRGNRRDRARPQPERGTKRFRGLCRETGEDGFPELVSHIAQQFGFNDFCLFLRVIFFEFVSVQN